MEKVRFWIRKTFGFSQKETNGFILLSFLILFAFFIPSIFRKFYPTDESFFQKDQVILDSLVKNWKKSEGKNAILVSKTDFECIPFDPNTAEPERLKDFLGSTISNNIVRYRSKGGVFYKPDQLKKIYGMNDTIFDRIKDCIQFTPNTSGKTEVVSQNELAAFDINKVDSITLQKIKGIGKVLASRIVRFRERLGGFISEDQYEEVYGLDSIVVERLQKKSFIVKDFTPVQFSISETDPKFLYAHPYIGKEFAKKILESRNKNIVLNKEQLSKIFPREKLIRLMPYLKE